MSRLSGGGKVAVAILALGAVLTVQVSAATVDGKALLIPVPPGEVSQLTKTVEAKPEVKPVAAAESPRLSLRERHALAIDKALAGDTKGAEEMLKSILNSPQSDDERDRVLLSLGRVQYQTGRDVDALATYKRIRVGAPSWLEALEEGASAHMRLGQPLEAIAALKTVLTPYFKDRVFSEPYYLIALANLRVCDYRSVFRILELFKSRFRDRVRTWESAKADPMARERLSETKDTIQKLNLVEAEAIQRLFIDDSGKPLSGSVPKIVRANNQLYFPSDPDVDSKEVWLDEIDNYRVTTKGCPPSSEQAELPKTPSQQTVANQKSASKSTLK